MNAHRHPASGSVPKCSFATRPASTLEMAPPTDSAAAQMVTARAR